MSQVRFVDTDHWKDWEVIPTLVKTSSGQWHAGAFVPASDPSDASVKGFLQLSSYGETPDEALAALERCLIETLAVGGQLEERRHLDRRNGSGRRANDIGNLGNML